MLDRRRGRLTECAAKHKLFTWPNRTICPWISVICPCWSLHWLCFICLHYSFHSSWLAPTSWTQAANSTSCIFADDPVVQILYLQYQPVGSNVCTAGSNQYSRLYTLASIWLTNPPHHLLHRHPLEHHLPLFQHSLLVVGEKFTIKITSISSGPLEQEVLDSTSTLRGKSRTGCWRSGGCCAAELFWTGPAWLVVGCQLKELLDRPLYTPAGQRTPHPLPRSHLHQDFDQPCLCRHQGHHDWYILELGFHSYPDDPT